ncbi:MAG: hypothetical protein WCU00_00440 [Candidatus Latescibacterota bacterium]
MSKVTKLSVSALLILFFAVHAEASTFLGKITSALSGDVFSLLLSAVLAVGAGIAGVLFVRIASTLKETGEFLATLGIALEDRKISRDELASIVKEAKDIFQTWK